MSSFIDIRYNIFTEKEIANLLHGFSKNVKNHKKYNDNNTIFLPVENEDKEYFYNKYKPYIYNNVIDWIQIVKWPKNSLQNIHIDRASRDTTISSITFLNDNFDGGETFFGEGTIVRPAKNKTIVFSGVNITHGVNKVLNGERYTIATWYKKK